MNTGQFVIHSYSITMNNYFNEDEFLFAVIEIIVNKLFLAIK